MGKHPKYDFAGSVTRNDMRCTDGVTIRHGAFKENDGKRVPLVWSHDPSTPENVIGHVELQNADEGVYGRGYFNNTQMPRTPRNLYNMVISCICLLGLTVLSGLQQMT